MEAVIIDPLVDTVDPGWDTLARCARTATPWRAELLTISAESARTTSALAVVSDHGTPVALFHGRLLGPHPRHGPLRPGTAPAIALFDCRLNVGSVAGHLFADGLDRASRVEAVTTFERALRRRFRWRIGGFVYRRVSEATLPAIRRTIGVTIASDPDLVLANEWSDLDDYLKSRPPKLRWRIRNIRTAVRTDPTLTVDTRASVPAEQAAQLVNEVRDRHAGSGTPSPPIPVSYFEALNADPDTTFIAYADDAGLVAVSTLHDTGSELVATYWGSRDHLDGGRKNIYFHQYAEAIDMMIRRGRERLQLGVAMSEIKMRFGAAPSPRFLVIRP